MLTSGHRMGGLTAGVCVVTATHAPLSLTTVLFVGTAALTAGGSLSPDVDQRRPWRQVDRILPDEALGHGGPMRHRGITHWWVIPVIMWLALVSTHPGGVLGAEVAGLALGWTSHLAGDFVFGAQSRYRGPGIPLAPWWHHIGIGLRCGGTAERVTQWVVLPGIMVGVVIQAVA